MRKNEAEALFPKRQPDYPKRYGYVMRENISARAHGERMAMETRKFDFIRFYSPSPHRRPRRPSWQRWRRRKPRPLSSTRAPRRPRLPVSAPASTPASASPSSGLSFPSSSSSPSPSSSSSSQTTSPSRPGGPRSTAPINSSPSSRPSHVSADHGLPCNFSRVLPLNASEVFYPPCPHIRHPLTP